MVETNKTQLNKLQQKVPIINDYAMMGVLKTKELEDQAKKLQTESQLENPDDLISHIGEVRYCFISALEKINQFKDVFDPLYAQVAELDGSDENDDGSG